jgi:hypothetical protein
MFFAWFAVAVVIVGLLTWMGAAISRRMPGTDWQDKEDRPIFPGDH